MTSGEFEQYVISRLGQPEALKLYADGSFAMKYKDGCFAVSNREIVQNNPDFLFRVRLSRMPHVDFN